MIIRFACPHCENLLEAAGGLAGRTGKCQGCGQTVQIPYTMTPSDAVAPEFIGGMPPVQLPTRAATSVRRQPFIILLIVLGAVILILAFLPGIAGRDTDFAVIWAVVCLLGVSLTWLSAAVLSSWSSTKATGDAMALPTQAAIPLRNHPWVTLSKQVFLGLVGIAGLWFVFFASSAPLSYKVLSESKRKNDKFSMNILVSEKASQQEVLNLAEYLRQKYYGKYNIINIFDSKEAWAGRMDDAYPEKKFWKHYLVQIGGKGWPDGKEIHWFADGRDH